MEGNLEVGVEYTGDAFEVSVDFGDGKKYRTEMSRRDFTDISEHLSSIGIEAKLRENYPTLYEVLQKREVPSSDIGLSLSRYNADTRNGEVKQMRQSMRAWMKGESF